MVHGRPRRVQNRPGARGEPGGDRDHAVEGPIGQHLAEGRPHGATNTGVAPERAADAASVLDVPRRLGQDAPGQLGDEAAGAARRPPAIDLMHRPAVSKAGSRLQPAEIGKAGPTL